MYCKNENHEAKIMSRLDHPGIPKIIDYGYFRDHQYLIMEFCEGVNLSDKQLLTADQEQQLLSLVKYLSDNGVTHHDIKPDHIIIQPDGQIRLIDFGIAKSRDYDWNIIISPEINKEFGTDDLEAARRIIKKYGKDKHSDSDSTNRP